MRLRERLVRVPVRIALVAVATALLVVPTLRGQRGGAGRGGGAVRLDSPKDMEMKIAEPFTLASVGDLIIMRPTSQLADPAFQGAIKIIKDSDFAVGNFEANAGDLLHWEGPMRGFMGTKETPADVKAMGFDP